MKVKQDRENERKKATEEAKRTRTRITQEVQQIEANVERTLAEIVAAQNFEVQKIVSDGRTVASKLQVGFHILIGCTHYLPTPGRER